MMSAPKTNLTSAMKDAESNVNLDKVILLDDKDIQAIQMALLFMFDDIVSVCEEYKIEYQLSGGSVLGAIRHGGGLFRGMMILILTWNVLKLIDS